MKATYFTQSEVQATEAWEEETLNVKDYKELYYPSWDLEGGAIVLQQVKQSVVKPAQFLM